jgi:hypothetical protein
MKIKLSFYFSNKSKIKPEVLSIDVRFPSGERKVNHYRLSEENVTQGNIVLEGFFSEEAGELTIKATLINENGGTSYIVRQFGVSRESCKDVPDSKLYYTIRKGWCSQV